MLRACSSLRGERIGEILVERTGRARLIFGNNHNTLRQMTKSGWFIFTDRSDQRSYHRCFAYCADLADFYSRGFFWNLVVTAIHSIRWIDCNNAVTGLSSLAKVQARVRSCLMAVDGISILTIMIIGVSFLLIFLIGFFIP